MKKIFSLLLCMVLILSFAACSKETPTPAEGPTPVPEESFSDVTMDVKEDSITDASAIFIITNNTKDKEYTYGTPWMIEKQEADSWELAGPGEDTMWTMMAFILAPQQEAEVSIDWSLANVTLESGTYRLVKSVTDTEGNSNQIYAEFSL